MSEIKPPPSSGTILLVEDDEMLARSISRILEGSGYDVVHARDGEAAIDSVRSRSFDAVLSDLNLPGAGGVEVLTAARAADPGLPLMLMTGDPTEAAEEAAIDLGVIGYLIKPTSRALLTRTLQRATASRRTSRPPPSMPESSSPTNPPPPDYEDYFVGMSAG